MADVQQRFQALRGKGSVAAMSAQVEKEWLQLQEFRAALHVRCSRQAISAAAAAPTEGPQGTAEAGAAGGGGLGGTVAGASEAGHRDVPISTSASGACLPEKHGCQTPAQDRMTEGAAESGNGGQALQPPLLASILKPISVAGGRSLGRSAHRVTFCKELVAGPSGEGGIAVQKPPASD